MRVEQPIESCVACGRALDTPFCPLCGEKRASDRRHSVPEFVRDHVLEAVANFDGRAIRTYKTLFRRPGELTAQFMRGVRLAYLSPLQCFLIVNVAFFLWSNAMHNRILDTTLAQHLKMNYGSTAARMVNDRLAKTGAVRGAFFEKFDTIGGAQAKSLVLVMVPVFALVIGLLTLGKRRFAVHHLVFALHTYSFALSWLAIGLFVITLILRWVVYPLGLYTRELQDVMMSVVVGVGISWYLALSLHRAYGFGWRRAIPTAIVAAFAIFMIMQQYRRLLFFVTFWSM